MNKCFRLKMSMEELERGSDMLRYDGAYEVKVRPDGVEVHTTTFTPERWASFGVHPVVLEEMKVSAGEYRERQFQAKGFISGIRFIQKLYPVIRLIEDYSGVF